MAEWFEGSGEIDCTIEDVKDGIADPGQFFVGVVSRMPGLTSVDSSKMGNAFLSAYKAYLETEQA